MKTLRELRMAFLLAWDGVFYALESAIVWQWFGVKKYDAELARAAWLIVAIHGVSIVVVGLLIRYLL